MTELTLKEEPSVAPITRYIPRTDRQRKAFALTLLGIAAVLWWLMPELEYFADNAIVVATFFGACALWFVSKHRERKRTRAYVCHLLLESHGTLPEDVLLDRLKEAKVKLETAHQEFVVLQKEGVLERVVGIADVVSYRLLDSAER